jgi:hypothetical protein
LRATISEEGGVMEDLTIRVAKLYPCIYAGAIRCRDCKILVDPHECDMRIGRENSQAIFIVGFNAGMKEKDAEIEKLQNSIIRLKNKNSQ